MLTDSVSIPSLLMDEEHHGQDTNMSPEATRAYHELRTLAQDDRNYWAQVAVEVIDNLLSDTLPENSILITPNKTQIKDRDEFVLTLPGCKLFYEMSPSGHCQILALGVDSCYGEKVEASANPGLYSATRIEDGWDTGLQQYGRLTEKEDRLVAICDSVYDSPADAAVIVARRICQAPMAGALRIKNKGFDLHFTPGERSLGGWKNYRKAVRPNQNSEVHDSALLLARTMYQSKDIDGVAWISEDGGSAVLTQAMTILSERGIKLPKHTAFLFNPTTPPDIALKAAQSIGLNLDSEFTKCRSFNIVGNGVGLATFNIVKFIFTAYLTFLGWAALFGFLPDVLPDWVMSLLIDLQNRIDLF